MTLPNTMIRRAALAASVLLAAVASVGVSHASVTQAAPRPATVLHADLVAMLAAAEPGELMIVFVYARGIDDAARAVQTAGLTLIERWEKIGFAVASGIPESIRRVAANSSVRYVEPNRPVELALDSAHIAGRARDARDPATGQCSPADLPSVC
jgi:hypothetical protein